MAFLLLVLAQLESVLRVGSIRPFESLFSLIALELQFENDAASRLTFLLFEFGDANWRQAGALNLLLSGVVEVLTRSDQI